MSYYSLSEYQIMVPYFSRNGLQAELCVTRHDMCIYLNLATVCIH